MAQGKKLSSEKVVDAITSKLKNPDKTTRDIAKEIGVSHSTVHGILTKEADKLFTSSNLKKEELMQFNIDIMSKAKELISNSMGTLPVERYDDLLKVSSIADHAFKQQQLMTGQPTDNVQGIGDILKQIQGVQNQNY